VAIQESLYVRRTLERAHTGEGSARQDDDRKAYAECVHGDPTACSAYQSSRHFAVRRDLVGPVTQELSQIIIYRTHLSSPRISFRNVSSPRDTSDFTVPGGHFRISATSRSGRSS
jgi:hypothetical protein